MKENKQNLLDFEKIKVESKEMSDDLYRKIKHIKELCDLGNVLKPPKGFFFKRCPECKSRLEKTSFIQYLFCGLHIKYTHYRCTKCNYEYAKDT